MAEPNKPTVPESGPALSEPAADGATSPAAVPLTRRWRELEVYRETRVAVIETAPRVRRQRRMFLIVAFILTLLGIFVGLLSWLKSAPSPFFVPLFITEYESRLVPINSQANPDREALRAGAYFPRTDENAFASQERHLFIQELASLKSRSRQRSLVVYICAFASSNDSGDVMLYPADYRPDNPTSSVSLRQMLRYVYESPAPRKLLVLDIMRPVAHGRLGVLEDDVAGRAKEVIDQELKNLPDPARLGLVFCSCSPGQVSLNSEDLGRSVFGYYFEQGLRGWSEGYGPDHERDGRIGLPELAEFVKQRVDRWAIRNRNTRQTPLLLGVASADGFQLLALQHGEAQPRSDAPEIAPYPPWLLDGWKLRDRWLADPHYQIDPRIMRQLEATLLRVEQEWRGGIDITRVQNDLKDRLEQLKSQAELARGLMPQPQPRSLALAFALGQKPDRTVSKDLQDLLTTVEQQAREMKPEEAEKAKPKLAQAFLEKIKNKTHFDLAWAAFELIADEANPSRDVIRFLDQLLLRQQPQPRYVETWFLHRLAGLTDQFSNDTWPGQIIHRALDVVRKGEQAVVDPRSLAWVQGELQEAAQVRYDAEVLLFARGYVPLDAADQLLRKANDAYDVLLSHEQIIQRAYTIRDQATAFLPASTGVLERFPSHEKQWHSAIEATVELGEVLMPAAGGAAAPPGNGGGASNAEAAAALRQRCELIRQKSDAVRSRLDDLRWPFAADRLASLIAQSRQPESTAAIWWNIDAILTAPYLRAEDRVALWQAGRELSHRLLDKTLELDWDEDDRQILTPRSPDYDADRARFERKQQELAGLRARTSLALLRLGGFAKQPLTNLTNLLKGNDGQAADAAPSRAFAQALRQAWADDLPEQLEQEKDLRMQDRLSRIVPPLDVVPRVDDVNTNPTVARRIQRARELWTWLVKHYRYESRDLDGSSFFAEAAIEYQRQALQIPESFLHMEGCSQLPNLTGLSPTAVCSLRLSLINPVRNKPKVDLEIITADDEWLQVRADTRPLQELVDKNMRTRTCMVPLRVELKPGAEFSRLPKPKGFLVIVRVDGQTYHHRVSIPTLPQSLAERVEVLLSQDPLGPSDPVTSLRLRPIKARQPYYLYVRNTTAKARNVIVQLRNGDMALRGGEVKLTVAANETKPVKFPLPAAPAPPAGTPAAPAAPPALPADLPEFPGPLGIRLLDADKPDGDLLDDKTIPLAIASPREYVQVSEIQFAPPGPKTGGKNRLQVKLKALAPIPGPPCLIELVLPAKRIPGFISAKDGSFRGDLPPPGEELVLYANNIILEPGAGPDGYIYLNVDGMERAFIFRTTFARSGDPTTPQIDDRPSLRLRASPFAASSPKYMVGVEVDNAPAGGSLEFMLNQATGDFETDILKKIPEARHQHIGFTPFTMDGALQFEASIQDVSIPLNTSGIRGRRLLRALLFDRTGSEIDEAEMAVVFDDSPPDKVRFFDVPSQALKDKPLALRASGSDSESGIAKVNFYLGKPVDDKMPATAMPVEATPTNDDKTEWTAKLQLTGILRGPTDVTVQFINGVGMSTFATTTIDLVDAADNKGPGKIKGTVVEGGRPQGGLTVVLHDPKEKMSDKDQKAVTKPDGAFEFDGVAPGSYTVSCVKVASERKGAESVVVQPNQTVSVTIMLFK